jgi:hypothetical protein
MRATAKMPVVDFYCALSTFCGSSITERGLERLLLYGSAAGEQLMITRGCAKV